MLITDAQSRMRRRVESIGVLDDASGLYGSTNHSSGLRTRASCASREARRGSFYAFEEGLFGWDHEHWAVD
jgi:hypothetical protein